MIADRGDGGGLNLAELDFYCEFRQPGRENQAPWGHDHDNYFWRTWPDPGVMYFDKRMNNGLIPYVYVLQLRFDGFLTELYARKGGKYQRMRVSAAAPHLYVWHSL